MPFLTPPDEVLHDILLIASNDVDSDSGTSRSIFKHFSGLGAHRPKVKKHPRIAACFCRRLKAIVYNSPRMSIAQISLRIDKVKTARMVAKRLESAAGNYDVDLWIATEGFDVSHRCRKYCDI